ncbi:hypothetical protein WOLCODRAFT_28776 [Wolfiporia cocos MD-104 SS10]|uniref:Uncharacterized protein n=1 Tax=Wolfiporia cocos (strain MD-104) TaxID=742152 RepID=A0A2H3JDL6_WOLCO|nr:hypothetical protein WOLCODRAFT_28776 [Wolfiporia cocos MD-104 SS10]
MRPGVSAASGQPARAQRPASREAGRRRTRGRGGRRGALAPVGRPRNATVVLVVVERVALRGARVVLLVFAQGVLATHTVILYAAVIGLVCRLHREVPRPGSALRPAGTPWW